MAPKLAPLVRARALPSRVRAALRRLYDAAAAGRTDRQLVAEVWREVLRELPAGSFRAGLLMLTGQVLELRASSVDRRRLGRSEERTEGLA